MQTLVQLQHFPRSMQQASKITNEETTGRRSRQAGKAEQSYFAYILQIGFTETGVTQATFSVYGSVQELNPKSVTQSTH